MSSILAFLKLIAYTITFVVLFVVFTRLSQLIMGTVAFSSNVCHGDDCLGLVVAIVILSIPCGLILAIIVTVFIGIRIQGVPTLKLGPYIPDRL